MNEQQCKQEKLSVLSEVKEFHPFLHSLFTRIPSISRVEYTHGNREMGADFILAKNNSVLGMEEFIGVVVKVGGIRQNLDDVERQIKECFVPRNFDGGKQKIVLDEIWVVTNGSISNNAQDKINHQYRDKKVKFIWLETVIRLTDLHYPEYWENIEDHLGLYLSSVERRVVDLNRRSNILEDSISEFYMEQDLAKIEFDARKKFNVHKRRSSESLSSIIGKERLVFVQGGMGFGKSRLLRQAAIEHAQHKHFAANRILPVFLTYRDLVTKFSNSLSAVLDHLKNEERVTLEDHSLLFLIDGVDEIKGDLETKANNIKSFVVLLFIIINRG